MGLIVIKKDVLVIGAGAAGLMCGIEAGKRGRKVSVIDHARKAGQKIELSGGGNCNFTNLHTEPEHYISQNPHFCKSALSRFPPSYFTSLLEKKGLTFYEKEKGQLFCGKGAGAVLSVLKQECLEAGVDILLNCPVSDVGKDSFFKVITQRGTFLCESLVIATGGLSYPKLGATGFGYSIAEKFGLKVIPLSPGLVPLKFNRSDLKFFSDLSGISLNAGVCCNNMNFTGNILFTHRGVSGPAILDISSYWNRGDAICIDLLPGIDIYNHLIKKQQTGIEMRNFLSLYFPKRFTKKWCEIYFKSKPLYQYTNKELQKASQLLKNWKLKPSDTEGYDRAEVTTGGVDTNEISSKTMEAKKVSRLYFAGEVIDVTGRLGGYNLQWAWSSGRAAGEYV